MIESPTEAIRQLRVVTVIPEAEGVTFVREPIERYGSTVEHSYVWISRASHKRLDRALGAYMKPLNVTGDFPCLIYTR